VIPRKSGTEIDHRINKEKVYRYENQTHFSHVIYHFIRVAGISAGQALLQWAVGERLDSGRYIRSHKAPLTLIVAATDAAGGADCRSKVRHLQGLNDDSAAHGGGKPEGNPC